MELFAAFQRLGLIPTSQFLPSWKFFIPFTQDSPIPAPPRLQDFSIDSIVRWAGGALISAMPFVLWLITQQLVDDWRPRIWQKVLTRLPSPIFGKKSIYTFETPPSLPSEVDEMPGPPSEPPSSDRQDGDHSGDGERTEEQEEVTVTTPEADESPLEQQQELEPTTVRRRSVQSAGVGVGEDFESDDDHEVISATLISFDLEPTEAHDVVPQGLWSAELRQSTNSEARPPGASANIYLSTMLTRLPSLSAAQILNDQILRLLIAPFEAVALRWLARTWQIHHGGLVGDLLGIQAPFGITLTWVVNFLKAEFVHLLVCGEIFAVSSSLASFLHLSEEQWKESGGNDWGTRLGISSTAEPLF